jgi:hypothetical protein
MAPNDLDPPVPRAHCPTCGAQMWVVMAPPLPTPEVKEDWLFKCPVCNVFVSVA